MSISVTTLKVNNRLSQVAGSASMCEREKSYYCEVEGSLRPQDFSGINNVGLMARALVVKNHPSTRDEKEDAKWQTLQVLTLSIASCIGRISIGICLSGAHNSNMTNFPCWVGLTADFAKHRGMRRAQLISGVAISFLVSQLVALCVQDIEHLQYPVFLVGISYGSTIGLLPVILIEWFGTSL